MSDNNLRDDFTEETKRIAGERVCLMCSICGCHTKAASSDGNDKVARKRGKRRNLVTVTLFEYYAHYRSQQSYARYLQNYIDIHSHLTPE